jgi:hypothetical protein
LEILAIAAAALGGLVGLAANFPPPSWSVFGFSIGTGILVVGALVHPLFEAKHPLRVPAAIAALLAFLGGVNSAAEVVGRRPLEALVFIVATGTLTAGLPVLLLHAQRSETAQDETEEEDPDSSTSRWTAPKYLTDGVGTAAVAAYAAGLLVIAAWLLVKRPLSQGEALSTVNVAEGAFDVMVFSLFRERFSGLFEAEAKQLAGDARLRPLRYEDWAPIAMREMRAEQEPAASGNAPAKAAADGLEGKRPADVDEGEPPGAATIVTLFLLGFGVLLALLGVIVEGAGVLGMNAGIKGGEPHDRVLAGGAIAAAVVIALAVGADVTGHRLSARGARSKKRAAPRNRPVVEVRPGPLALAMIAALTVIAWHLLDSGATPHLPAVAALGAAFYAAITWEALVASPLDVQLVRAGAATTVLIFTTALAVASAGWWLLSTGLWSHGGPAPIGRAVLASVIALLPVAVLAIAVQQLLQWSGTGEVFTPEPPWVNAFFDHGQYVILFLIAAVVPAVGIAHIDAHTTPVTVVSSLLFVPGLVGGFLWVMDNNRHHHRLERAIAHPRKPMWDRARRFVDDKDDATDEAEQWLGEYKAAMDRHRLLQNFGAKAFLAAGMIALVVRSLGVA